MVIWELPNTVLFILQHVLKRCNFAFASHIIFRPLINNISIFFGQRLPLSCCTLFLSHCLFTFCCSTLFCWVGHSYINRKKTEGRRCIYSIYKLYHIHTFKQRIWHQWNNIIIRLDCRQPLRTQQGWSSWHWCCRLWVLHYHYL